MWKITICEHLKTTIHNIIAMSRHTRYKYISEDRDLKKKIQLFQNCYFDLYSAIFTLILQHSPKNYAFGYAVKDDYTGDDYSHKESRDGYTTSGEYRVIIYRN